MDTLITYNKGALTFSIKNETDAKLVSLAIQIMADIEKKGDAGKEHLNRNPFWIYNKQEAVWWSLNEVMGVFLWGFTDATDPYDLDSLVGADGSIYRYYRCATHRTYWRALCVFRTEQYVRYMELTKEALIAELGISADRMGSTEDPKAALRAYNERSSKQLRKYLGFSYAVFPKNDATEGEL